MCVFVDVCVRACVYVCLHNRRVWDVSRGMGG